MDGHTLASGSEDGTVMTWDLKDARRIALSPQHAGPVWSLAYSNGSDNILASGKERLGKQQQLWCKQNVLE